MQQSLKIPAHSCQWCYKVTGRLIIDCLCLACEQCFKQKKSWVDQNSRCFYCQRPTQRKFIDLKVNPHQGGLYFQSVNVSLKNSMKVQEFQSQVSRKYCKHLEKKVSKLETIIKTFVKQFPQYQSFFQNMMVQYEQRQNNFRSKSVNETDSQSNKGFGQMVFHNNSEKNLQRQNPQIQSNGNVNHLQHKIKLKNPQPPLANQTPNQGFPNYPSKHNKNLQSISSNKQAGSIHGQYSQNPTSKYGIRNKSNLFHQMQVKNPVYQNSHQAQRLRGHQNNNMNHMNNNEPSPVLIYQIGGGNNKFSDPTKQQMNLNNINMQTALRSIKSDQGRENYMPFYQHNPMQSKRNNKRNEAVTNHSIQSPKSSRNANGDTFIFNMKKGPK